MAKKLYEEQNITDIANAIREKHGNNIKYKPANMANAIRAIEVGGGGEDIERIVFNKSLIDTYMFANNCWNEYMPNIFFEGSGCLISGDHIFYQSNQLESIPNTLVFSSSARLKYPFHKCEKLKQMPTIIANNGGKVPLEPIYAFTDCKELKGINLKNFSIYPYVVDGSKTNLSMKQAFYNCYQLEGTIDMANIGETIESYYIYEGADAFLNCQRVNEILNVPFYGTAKSVSIYDMFVNCFSLSRLTFAKNSDGTNKDFNYSGSATVRLYCWDMIGYVSTRSLVGEIGPKELEITNDETYQKLKDNPNSWTASGNYAKYNRTSAVETIKSLPNFIPSGTQTAVIQFYGAAGLKTDGGAINTMTAEEAAIAAAKGWTIALV